MKKGPPEASKPKLVFNPTLCPLLDGLTPEEQAERMETDPVIRACMHKLEGGVGQLKGCHVSRAYASRATRRAAVVE